MPNQLPIMWIPLLRLVYLSKVPSDAQPTIPFPTVAFRKPYVIPTSLTEATTQVTGPSYFPYPIRPYAILIYSQHPRIQVFWN